MRELQIKWTKDHNLLPCLPPFLLVVSVGMGVTSSIRPILIPLRAIALMAAWAPGAGDLLPVPPRALSLMCTAVILSCLRRLTTSIVASIAAYSDASSLSDLTFIPPVTRIRVSLPVKSVTWMKVSFFVERIWHTAKRSPDTFCGPKCTTFFVSSPSSSFLAPFFFFWILAGSYLVSFGCSVGFTYAINLIYSIFNILLKKHYLSSDKYKLSLFKITFLTII